MVEMTRTPTQLEFDLGYAELRWQLQQLREGVPLACHQLDVVKLDESLWVTVDTNQSRDCVLVFSSTEFKEFLDFQTETGRKRLQAEGRVEALFPIAVNDKVEWCSDDPTKSWTSCVAAYDTCLKARGLIEARS